MKFSMMAFAMAAGLLTATQAGAVSLVINGGFETTTSGAGEINTNTQATGWYVNNGSNSYTHVASASSPEAWPSQYGSIGLWTTNNGGVDSFTASPDGGNFIVMDGNFPGHNEPLNQDITGLLAGHTYVVGFDYAYGQQYTFDGDTIQHWDVSLGSSPVQSTADYTVVSHHLSGWSHTTMRFVANSTSETLSFLAYGNKALPPFALLDGVTLDAVPEPATWTMMILGVGGIGALARRRRALGLSTATAA